MTDPTETAALIRARAGEEPVRLGLILGSGLGHLAQAVAGRHGQSLHDWRYVDAEAALAEVQAPGPVASRAAGGRRSSASITSQNASAAPPTTWTRSDGIPTSSNASANVRSGV